MRTYSHNWVVAGPFRPSCEEKICEDETDEESQLRARIACAGVTVPHVMFDILGGGENDIEIAVGAMCLQKCRYGCCQSDNFTVMFDRVRKLLILFKEIDKMHNIFPKKQNLVHN